MELPESASLTNNRAVWQACLSHESAAGLGDGVLTAGEQEAAEATGAGSGQGRDSGRKAGKSRASVAAEEQKATSKDMLKKDEWLQQQQWDRKTNWGKIQPCRGCTSSDLHGTHNEGLLGLPRSSSYPALTRPLPIAASHSQRKEPYWHQWILLWGITVGKRQFSTALPLACQAQRYQDCQSTNFTLEFQPRPERCQQPWQWTGRRAPVGCGAMGASSAPGTAKGAPTRARTHSAAVWIVCTRQCLTTAFTLFRMEKTPLYTFSQQPLCSQFTWEFSMELWQELFLQQHSWVFSLLLNYWLCCSKKMVFRNSININKSFALKYWTKDLLMKKQHALLLSLMELKDNYSSVDALVQLLKFESLSEIMPDLLAALLYQS